MYVVCILYEKIKRRTWALERETKQQQKSISISLDKLVNPCGFLSSRPVFLSFSKNGTKQWDVINAFQIDRLNP
jgi:hypothetical protein